MDGDLSSRNSLWFEDLERHRQPCLYYLSSEDDGGGPHLVCDWNGPPTDYREFDFDIAQRRIDLVSDMSHRNEKKKPTPDRQPTPDNNEEEHCKYSTHALLTENDGARLDLLTVPPIVNSLMLRKFQEYKKASPTSKSTDSEQIQPSERRNIVKKTGKPAGRPRKDKDQSASTSN